MDKDTCVELHSDPTVNYRKDLSNLVDYGYDMRVLNKKERRYLIPSFSRVPTIYTLPKVHEDPQNPPARPIIIVNSIGSVSSRVGQYLDNVLQKSVMQTSAYLRDHFFTTFKRNL